MKETKQAVAPLEGKAEEQICFVRRPALRPHSLTPIPPFLHVPLTHSLFVSFLLFFFFLLKTFTRFCHPHAWLQATSEVKWKGREAVDFKCTFLQGVGGLQEGGLQSYMRPVNSHREDGREYIKYDLKYDLNKKHTSSLLFSLPQFKSVFVRARLVCV